LALVVTQTHKEMYKSTNINTSLMLITFFQPLYIYSYEYVNVVTISCLKFKSIYMDRAAGS